MQSQHESHTRVESSQRTAVSTRTFTTAAACFFGFLRSKGIAQKNASAHIIRESNADAFTGYRAKHAQLLPWELRTGLGFLGACAAAAS